MSTTSLTEQNRKIIPLHRFDAAFQTREVARGNLIICSSERQ